MKNKVQRIINELYSFSEKDNENPFSGKNIFDILKKKDELFELPKDKNFWDMPINHYVELVNRKGRVDIEGALIALRVLNANYDTDISKKAENIRLELKKKFNW